MTENEVLIKTPEEAIETIKSNMPTSGYQMLRESLDMAIIALKEIQQYREIGTVEECREAKRFKEYFDELYGIGLEVANWHQNGNTEPFDNFYDAAIDWSEQNE